MILPAVAISMEVSERQDFMQARGMIEAYPKVCSRRRLDELARERGFDDWDNVVRVAAAEK